MEISKPSPPEERSILLSPNPVCDALCQAINDYLYDIIYENTNPENYEKSIFAFAELLKALGEETNAIMYLADYQKRLESIE